MSAPLESAALLPGGPVQLRTRRAKLKNFVDSNVGLLLVTGAQVFFALMSVTVKALSQMSPPVSALELVLVRMAVTYLCCAAYMIITGVPDPFLGPKGVRRLLAFRGFTGFISLFGIYYSLQYLSLSDATVLTFLVPICAAIAGSLTLGEPFTLKQALAGIVSLAGVVLIARPTWLFKTASTNLAASGASRTTAVGIALIGVLGGTGAYTTLRAIGKRAHPMHALSSFAFQSIVVASFGMWITKEAFVVPTDFAWLAMFSLMGVFGLCAQLLLTLGLQREAVGRASIAMYTQILFATVFERVFFDAVPSLLSFAGTGLILSSAIYVAVTKERRS